MIKRQSILMIVGCVGIIFGTASNMMGARSRRSATAREVGELNKQLELGRRGVAIFDEREYASWLETVGVLLQKQPNKRAAVKSIHKQWAAKHSPAEVRKIDQVVAKVVGTDINLEGDANKLENTTATVIADIQTGASTEQIQEELTSLMNTAAQTKVDATKKEDAKQEETIVVEREEKKEEGGGAGAGEEETEPQRLARQEREESGENEE